MSAKAWRAERGKPSARHRRLILEPLEQRHLLAGWALPDKYFTPENTPLTVSAPGVFANDQDAIENWFGREWFSQAKHGRVALDLDGSFVYWPATDFLGVDSFTYRLAASHLSGGSAGTVTVSVGMVNHEPEVIPERRFISQWFTTQMDAPLHMDAPGVLNHFRDPDGDRLTATLVSGPRIPFSNLPSGTLTLSLDGSFTYIPPTGLREPVQFTFQVSDGKTSKESIAHIRVSEFDSAPNALDDHYTTSEDTSLSIAAPGVLDNDSDSAGRPLCAVPEQQLKKPVWPAIPGVPQLVYVAALHGAATLNCDGSLSYVPEAEFHGVDKVTYFAESPDGQSPPNGSRSYKSYVWITVTPVNDVPLARDDSFSRRPDEALHIRAPGVLLNDKDVESFPSAILVSGPSHGTVTLLAEGSFSYVPNVGYSGPDSFTYRAGDGQAASEIATASIMATPANTPPMARYDSFAIFEDLLDTNTDRNYLGNALANDTDADGNPLTAVLAAGPVDGNLTFTPNGRIYYTPSRDHNGIDSFTYYATDGDLRTTATVWLIVAPVNDIPRGTPHSYTTSVDIPLKLDAPGVLTNVTDPEGDPLTTFPSIPSQSSRLKPPLGEIELEPDGSLIYTPAPGYVATGYFFYHPRNARGIGQWGEVSVTVVAPDSRLTGNSDSFTTPEDATLTINGAGVLSNDSSADAGPLSASLFVPPVHGKLTLAADGSFTYVPTTNYHGVDSFTYAPSNGIAYGKVVTVAVTVTAVSDPPATRNDSYLLAKNTTLTRSVPGILTNDVDPEGDPMTAVIEKAPEHGTVSLGADGSFSYVPDHDFAGTDSFTYRPSDGSQSSDPVTVWLDVTTGPVAVDDLYTVTEDIRLDVDAAGVIGNDIVGGRGPLEALLFAPPDHGQVELRRDGSLSYLPLSDYNGPDSFSYLITDGTRISNLATVSLKMTPVDDVPAAFKDGTWISYTGGPVAKPVTAILGDGFDVDGDKLTALLEAPPAHGTLNFTADGGCLYVPAAGFRGYDSFTYRMSDGKSVSEPRRVWIHVLKATPIFGEAPVAHNDAYAIEADGTLTVAAAGVLANDGDPDSAVLTAFILESAKHGTVVLNSDGGLTYTPTRGFVGRDSFTYFASDELLDSGPATVSITVAEPHVLHNSENRLDVNGDAAVSSLDLLLIFNHLNTELGKTVLWPEGEATGRPFLDVSGDGRVSSIDALLVINTLNRDASGAGESAPSVAALSESSSDGTHDLIGEGGQRFNLAELISLLALDMPGTRKRGVPR